MADIYDPFAQPNTVGVFDPFKEAVKPPTPVPTEYEEPEGNFRTDMTQVLSKAGEGPVSVISDFLVNPVAKALGAEDDVIDAEMRTNMRKTFIQGLAPLLGVKPKDVLTESGEYQDYSTVAGPVGELGTLVAGGAGAFKALDRVSNISDFKKGVTSGLIAEELYFQEGEGNLARGIEDSFDIESQFLKDTIEYLSTDEGDSVLTQRFKVGLEGVILGGAVEKFLSGVGIVGKKFMPNRNSSVDEQADELLTFIDENKNEIEIAPSAIHADVEFSPNPNSVAQVEQQNSKWYKRFLNQMFSSRGYWTEEADNMFRGKQYAERQTIREAENIATRLNMALDELPVDQLDEGKLTRALTQDFEFSPVASFDAKVEWVAADLNIPQEVASDIVRAREMIDDLSARIYNSTVPSDEAREVIRQNVGQYMTRSYRAYEDGGYVPSESVIHNATKYIQTAMMNADETLEDGKAFEQAYIKVQEILEQSTSSEDVFDFYSKNVQINRDILKRKDQTLPKEIRELLGEVENPTENIVLTISKMAQLAENAEFGANLLKSARGSYIFDEKRVFGTSDGKGKIFYNTKIEGTGTALDGKYTTPEIATAIAGRQSRLESYEDMAGVRLFASAKATSQAMKTVGSWTTHVRNLMGGVQFGLANGISPIGEAKVFNTLMNAAAKRGDKGLDSLYEEYLGLGIINTNVRLNEFRTLFDDAARMRAGDKTAKIDATYGRVGKAVDVADEVVLGGASKTYKAAEELYRGTDDFFKIHAFEKELDFLRRAMPDAPIDDLKKEAASIVQDTFPNYDKVPNGIKSLRFLPVGSFVSFPAEIVRTSWNIIKQGHKEINSDNPVIKRRGMQRLGGYIATNSLWATSAKIGAVAMGLSEEESEAIQEMSHTPWSKAPKIPVRWGDEIVTIDTQFIDSYSTVKEPFMVMADRIMRGEIKGENQLKSIGVGILEGVAKSLTPYTDQAIITEAFTDIITAYAGDGRTSTGQQLIPADDPEKALGNIAYHMFEAFVPGTITSLQNIGIAADGELYPGVRTPKKDLETEVIRNALGIPTKLMRPEQAIYFAGDGYKNKASETTRPKLAADVEGEDYVEDMRTRYENLYKYQQDLYMTMNAVLTRMEPNEARILLADQIGKKAADTILGNRFYLPEVPKLEEFLKLKDVTAEEAMRYQSEVIQARDKAIYTRLIPVDEEEGPSRSAFKKGGEVLIPQAPDEPDERIDKMTGRPYIEQAGGAFTDEEDRSGFAEGGSFLTKVSRLMEEGAEKFFGVGAEDLRRNEAEAMALVNRLVDEGSLHERERVKVEDGRVLAGDVFNAANHMLLAKMAGDNSLARAALQGKEYVQQAFGDTGFHGATGDRQNNFMGFNLYDKAQGDPAVFESFVEENLVERFGKSTGGVTRRFAVAKGGKIDKKKMACNKPKRTPNHPKKSHVVKACKDGKEKIIRFGEQGAKTAGKPKSGESKRMKAKRKSFKARHRKNIKRGNMSAAYWADKVKW